MTFDEYVQLYGINKAERYSYAQVASMLGRSKGTVRNWCNYGLRTKQGQHIALERHSCGQREVIVGEDLITFLRATQP
jgi:hypothetical protein